MARIKVALAIILGMISYAFPVFAAGGGRNYENQPSANAVLSATRIPSNTALQQLPAQQGMGGNQQPTAIDSAGGTAPTTALQAMPSFYGAGDANDPNAPSESEVATPEEIEAARNQAFNQLALNTLPMTPAQIQKLRNLFADSQRAATVAPGGMAPKPVASTQIVSLEPGSTPPIIRLAQGYVTSVVFLDNTGAPWPIKSYDVGNPGAFNIQWDRKSNILMIQSSALYTTGNLAVQLQDLNIPIMITLIPGQPIVDYRLDMRVQGYGPNALPHNKSTALPEAAGNELVNILDGIPPAKAQPLRIPGSRSQAWLAGNRIYLRTRLNLLSPAWVASMNSADGTHAYQIPRAPSILVSDENGKVFNLRIEGY